MTKYRNCSRVVGSRSLAPATALLLGHLSTTGPEPGAWCPVLVSAVNCGGNSSMEK